MTKVTKKAKQKLTIESVFCARCIWLLGHLCQDKNIESHKTAAKKHYLSHLEGSFKIIVMKKGK